MLTGFNYTIKDGKIDNPGIDWSGATPELIYLGERYGVARQKGHTYWADRMNPSVYAPSSWYIFQFTPLNNSRTRIRVTRVLDEVEPGNRWRQAKKELLARCAELDGDAVG